ncbi:MAG: hypothetical protein LBK56_13940, partial [Gracilibacteraceae bacterium]|nr:hypothetical protein [Gracilibacteraceae bacterium]
MIIRNKTLNAVVSVCLAVALFLAAAPTAFADPPPDDAVEKLIALYTRIGVATNYGALGLRSLTDALDLGEANLDVRYVKALASWAAIAAMATGQNPRLSAVYFPGTVNSQPCDLISVLLERMGVDGSYGSAATGVDEQSGAERGSAQINALLALEMYYGGADWGVPGGNERQTRVSAIETFLGDIQDAKKTDGANPAAMNWSVENGRFYFAETVPSFTLLANVATDMQPLAVALLCRWLEDETPVRVNGAEPAPLKEVAAREIPGLLKTCLAMYAVSGTETGHKIETGATSQAQTALRTRVSRAEYQAKLVTALIAAGEKDLVDELGLIETLETYRADRFDRDSLLDTDPQTPIIIADLDKYDGGYISLNAYDRNATAWVAMAYGDYLYDRSILSTFVMDRDLDNASSVEFDLNILVLPEYAEGKLYLPVLGDMGSAVTWTSSNSAVIDPVTGIVTPGGAVVTVWLTAEAVKGDALAAREFFVVVPAQVSGAQAALAADLRNLIIPLFTTADIDLPVAGEQGSAIVWASSDTDVIKDEGKVTLAADERKITLTATLTSGDAQAEKVFPVRVGRIVAEDDLATKAVYLMREYYQTQETRNFRSNPAVDRFGFGYWSVWLAKAALGDDFADYGFNLPDPRLHKLSRIWQGTDYGAVILQLLAQGDNPYDHFGVDYVEAMHDYIGTDSGAYHWGPFASEVFLAMALDATGEMTPELYRSVQGGLLGWTGYMGLGPDIGSWAMVPLAGHYSDEYANQAQIEAAFGSFRKLLLAGLVMDVKDDNYGLTVVKDIGGYIHATSNACVLIGAVAAQGIGFPGFDLLNGDEWITNKGKPNETTIIKQLYKYAFEGKDGPYSTQVAIAFADLYNGENIWASVGITPDDFAALLDETETVLTAGGEEYTAATVAALRLAYAEAAEFAEASYGYGRAYFALRDAYRGLKPAGATAVTILGAEETLFDTAYVVSEGSALEILAQYASEYRISQTATATGALEIDGIWPAEGAQWRVYSGETRLTDLGIPLGEGAELTFKYAADAALIPADATLGEHLARETASTLSLESEVTEDLVLLNSGNFGTTITWNSN